MKEYLNKWKNIHVMDQKNLTLLSENIPQTDLQIQVNPIRIPNDADKLIVKFIWNSKALRKSKIILEKKDKVGGLSHPEFKTYYRTMVMNTIGAGSGTDLRIHH